MQVPVCEPLFLDVNNQDLISCDNWQFVELVDLINVAVETFDVSQLDPVTMASAFGGGFILVATAHAIGISIAAIINFIKSA